MTKIPPDDILESLYKLRTRESDQLRTVLQLYDMEIHQRISRLDDQKLKTMVRRSLDQKHWLRNFDARHEKIETGAWSRVKRDQVVLEEEKVFVTNGKIKASVRRETSAVSGMRVTIVQSWHQKTRHPLSHQLHKARGRCVSRTRNARGRSQSERLNRPSCKILLERYLHQITLWVLASSRVSIQKKLNRDVNSTQSAPSRTGRLKNNQTKKPKKGDDKSAVAVVKSVRQLSCVSQDTEPPGSATISRKGTKVLEPIRRVRFTRAALRQANIRENKGPSLGKIQNQNSSSAKSPTLWNLRTDLQERLQDKSDVSAEMRGETCQENL